MADNTEKAIPMETGEITRNDEDVIAPTVEKREDVQVNDLGDLTEEQRQKINAFWGRADDLGAEPTPDFLYILDKIVNMAEEEAMEILVNAIEYHKNDPNFPGPAMEKIKLLVQGPKANNMERADYDFELKAEAAIIHYHSPYPEVRSVTDPFDDPTIPVETFRAYFLGMCWMGGVTALNTFFSPRQPGISINSTVMQLLLAPCGQFLAKVLPDWGFTVWGTRHSLNPGPWSYKEQMFATVLFTVANNAGAT
jgi:hypothetical protein